jgi:transposase
MPKLILKPIEEEMLTKGYVSARMIAAKTKRSAATVRRWFAELQADPRNLIGRDPVLLKVNAQMRFTKIATVESWYTKDLAKSMGVDFRVWSNL